jgi:hypothetical protein
LLRFAHKTFKNRLKVDFLPCKLRSNRRFAGRRIIVVFATFSLEKDTKTYKCNRLLAAAFGGTRRPSPPAARRRRRRRAAQAAGVAR